MGLFTGLLTLPLAPVRGVAAVAGVIAAEAERELYGTHESVQRELSELQRDMALGLIDEAEYDKREGELLERLFRVRGVAGSEGHVGELDMGGPSE